MKIQSTYGDYFVSSDGVISRDGKTIKPLKTVWGYAVVNLSVKGKVRQYRIHRLVAKAFIPNPTKKKYVNHIDNDPQNNAAYNLEWCTQKENMAHCAKQNRQGSSLKKLTASEVKEIRANKLSQPALAKKFGVSLTTISRVINKKTWKKN